MAELLMWSVTRAAHFSAPAALLMVSPTETSPLSVACPNKRLGPAGVADVDPMILMDQRITPSQQITPSPSALSDGLVDSGGLGGNWDVIMDREDY